METIYFVSLGCDKNLCDSEKMLGILNDMGYRFTDDKNLADIIIVNTCAFIGDAKEESINTIIDLGRLKENGCCRYLFACGCLSQRYKEEVTKLLPEVDGIIGTDEIERIAELIEQTVNKNASKISSPVSAKKFKPDILQSDLLNPDKDFSDKNKSDKFCSDKGKTADNIRKTAQKKSHRILSTPGHYAFLKIAEGCDKKCTYCIIPHIRGRYISVPMEELLEEARYLAESGVKEIILVAQETTVYGVDLYGKKMLPKLLSKLCRIEKLEWIRLLYLYPEEINDELLDTIKCEQKICNYLDIPVQHASDGVLKRMGRKATSESIRNVICRIKEKIPDIIIRTTLMTGFPGETQNDYNCLLEFVKEMKFDRLGTFCYSREEGTPAYDMDCQVPERVKKKRKDTIMETSRDIIFKKSKSFVGRTLRVLIEGKLVGEDGVFAGRTYADAPDVDGMIFVSSNNLLITGDMVDVIVDEALGYDLTGHVV